MSGEREGTGWEDLDLLESRLLNQEDKHSSLSEQALRWMSAGPLRGFLVSSIPALQSDRVQ